MDNPNQHVSTIRIGSRFNGYFNEGFPLPLCGIINPMEYVDIIKRVNSYTSIPKMFMVLAMSINLFLFVVAHIINSEIGVPKPVLFFILLSISIGCVTIFFYFIIISYARNRIDHFFYCVNSANQNLYIHFEYDASNISIIIRYMNHKPTQLQPELVEPFGVFPILSPYLAAQQNRSVVNSATILNLDHYSRDTNLEIELLSDQQMLLHPLTPNKETESHSHSNRSRSGSNINVEDASEIYYADENDMFVQANNQQQNHHETKQHTTRNDRVSNEQIVVTPSILITTIQF